MIQSVLSHTTVTYDGLVSVIDQVRYCEEHKFEGAFVGLGTWKGGCLALMALANLRYGIARRTLHGFDSFEGMPARNLAKDTDDSSVNLKPGSLAASLDDVRKIMNRTGYPPDSVSLHKGWFQDTVPPAVEVIGPIAILRLDGDLYDSYLVGLENFWTAWCPAALSFSMTGYSKVAAPLFRSSSPGVASIHMSATPMRLFISRKQTEATVVRRAMMKKT